MGKKLRKVPVEFAKQAAEYYQGFEPEDIKKLIADTVAENPVPKATIEDCIYTLELSRSQEMWYAVREGAKNPRPSRKILDLIKLLKQALVTDPRGDQIKVFLPKDATFAHYAQLKVEGGKDQYTTLRLPALIKKAGVETKTKIESMWDKDHPLDDKTMSSVLRWFLRGLSLEQAINKASVDYQINRQRTLGRGKLSYKPCLTKKEA